MIFTSHSRNITLFALLLLGACTGESTTEQSSGIAEDSMSNPGDAVLVSGIEVQNFDTSIGPGDDFYRYVNGVWLDTTVLPADKSNFGSFTHLADEAEASLRIIIEEAAEQNAQEGTDAQKVGDFFASFMDTDTIESLGAEPLQSTLAEIDAIGSRNELLVKMVELNHIGVQMPLGVYVNNDAMQSDQYISYLSQDGLGLPDRDWYLTEDDESHALARAAYREFIGTVLELAGYERAAQAADSVLAIEFLIAQAHWDRVKNRQRELTYNKMSLDDLNGLTADIDWGDFITAIGITETSYVVRQPSFIEDFNGIWNDISLAQWKDYTSFKFVDSLASYLNDDFVQANFEFYDRTLSGLEEMRPRWKRGVDRVDGSLGEVVGNLYVEKHFQEQAKVRMDDLIENLREAFRVGINDLEWMTPPTKAQAQEKLAKFTTKIGYPEEWKDYSALTVDASDLIGNVLRSRRVEHNRELAKLGGPINRGEWFMTPHTVNAYYNPPMNEIVFPAAILQPPFFNVDADGAVNYGAIGAVIGHEFSHGFDDQGRKSDGDGNLRDWWTEEDAQAFTSRADNLVAQYNQFEVLPEKFLNGAFTLGENIGDLSGLAVAYQAYHMSLNGESAPVIDGLTGDQRFFMGWAQIWRRLYRDENLEMRITSDPHSHSEARSNGVVRNFDAWYSAFNIEPGDAMYLPPEERVKIW
ncbi:MAG: M13-type metalloendopeptidase [Gammaproteobacteria bacterium]|nr:M13-type metalloendopeptidase [Gammaproteobacteria bacterium]